MARPRGTGPGDLVLVHFQGRPATFARIEDIRPQGRPGWFFCDLLVLTVPPQPMTWILEREQIDGVGFTMGGQPVRIERAPDVGALHEEMRRVELAKEKADRTATDAALGTSDPTEETLVGADDAWPPPEGESPRKSCNFVRLFPRG
ncbi:MAG: hypothetical protein ACKO2K_17420 [Alphaproteobacteria bacterium]